MRGRGSGSQRVRAPWAQPGCVWGGSHWEPPTPAGRATPTLLGAPGLRHSPVPHPMHTLARTPSPHPDPLWDTPRDTQRLTLACGPSPSPSDACTLHPRCTFSHHRGAHTHIPSLTHTHSWSHTLSKGEATQGTHTGTACPGCSQSPRGPHAGSQVDQEEHVPLPWWTYTAQSCLQAPCGAPPEGSGSRALGALAESLASPRLLDR